MQRLSVTNQNCSQSVLETKGYLQKVYAYPRAYSEEGLDYAHVLKDPDKAPDIARRSYLMKKRLMP